MFWHDPCWTGGLMSDRSPGYSGTATGQRLLDRVRDGLAVRHYSPRTTEAYETWIRRFIRFHNRRHPAELGPPEVAAVLSSLATNAKVSSSTQNQALAAVLFLYSDVLKQDLGTLADFVRAKKSQLLPVVMTRTEVAAVLVALQVRNADTICMRPYCSEQSINRA